MSSVKIQPGSPRSTGGMVVPVSALRLATSMFLTIALLACSGNGGGAGTPATSADTQARADRQNASEVAAFETFACDSRTFRDYHAMLGWSKDVLEAARLMLADPLRSECWARAAFVIGIVAGRLGDDPDLGRIIAWLERGPVDVPDVSGEPRPIRLSKLLGFQMAPYAIAFFAGLRGESEASQRAVEYLIGCTDRDFWEDKTGPWEDRGFNGTTFAESLSLTCITALGFTGSYAARTRLTMLLALSKDDPRHRDTRLEALAAFRTLERIAAEGGLESYALDDGGQGLNKGLPR